jgi:cbb3-type cytochrome oxidase subunit 3
MQKALKMILAAILGVIGICVLIWVLSTTSSEIQQASARGEAFGVILGIGLFIAIGAAIYKHGRRKS